MNGSSSVWGQIGTLNRMKMLLKDQKIVLAQMIFNDRELLFGENGPNVSKVEKQEKWIEIFIKLNAMGANIPDYKVCLKSWQEMTCIIVGVHTCKVWNYILNLVQHIFGIIKILVFVPDSWLNHNDHCHNCRVNCHIDVINLIFIEHSHNIIYKIKRVVPEYLVRTAHAHLERHFTHMH